jgi:hypothetical protein
MVTTVAQPTQPATRRARIWRGVVSLKPLKKHIDWWLRILAILAVPLIIGCTIVIGAELAAPEWFETDSIGKQLATITEDLLNAAIEGSMLGCIALSKQARCEGKTSTAKIMRNLGWLFAALTVVTVGFRVFHAPNMAGEILLWVRCAAGIVFCYLCHMNDEEEDGEVITPQQHRSQMEELTENFTKQLQAMTKNFDEKAANLTKALDEITSLKADIARLQTVSVSASTSQVTAQKADTEAANHQNQKRTQPLVDQTEKADSDRFESGQSNQEKAAMSATSTPSTTQATCETKENKLEQTIQFLRDHPERVKDANFEAQLAAHLNLKRAASARFWYLKAVELLKAEREQAAANNQAGNNGESSFARVLAFVQTHEPTIQKEMAATLAISERTIRRHLTTIRESGQLPLAWCRSEDAESGQTAESKADTEAVKSGKQKADSDRF